MPEKLFDNFVRDKLGGYPSPVPEGLWDKIITDKRRRPKGFWWWNNNKAILSAVGVVAVLTGVYFIVNNQKNNQSNNNSTLQTISSTQSNNNNSSTATTLSDESKQALANNGNDKNVDASANETATTNNNAAAASSNNHFISSGFANAEIHNKKRNTSLNNNTFLVGNNEHIFQPTNNQTDASLTSTEKKNEAGALMSSYRNNLYNRNSTNNPPLNLRSILGLGSDCPSANGYQRNDWYLEVYGSPDYTMKSVAGNGLSSVYLQKKDSAERMREGFTVGARFAKTVGDHFIVKAGLQYSQINERFSLRSENQRITTTVIINRTVVRPQGDTTFNDTTTVTQIGYATRTNINHYRNVEIPISLGYEFGEEKDKWKIGVNGGVILNIASSYVGETLDTSLNIVSYSSKNSSGFYNTKVGLSLYGGVSIIRNINDKLDVFAEPYFRYSLSNVSSSIGYSQRFSTAGLTLGVRMKLNKRQHL